MLNRWQVFWKSLDEARFVVRTMLLLIFVGVVSYVWFVTHRLFGIISMAMEAETQAGGQGVWTNLAVILAAVTAFAGVTIPVLVGMFKQVWDDYRSSGTDWSKLCDESEHLPGTE